jgi:hypothetical protein
LIGLTSSCTLWKVPSFSSLQNNPSNVKEVTLGLHIFLSSLQIPFSHLTLCFVTLKFQIVTVRITIENWL